MPRYYFHLTDSVDEVPDPESLEMPSVSGDALMQARDCMAGDVKSGKIDLHYRIDVHAERGAVVHTVKFEDAVEIVPAK